MDNYFQFFFSKISGSQKENQISILVVLTIFLVVEDTRTRNFATLSMLPYHVLEYRYKIEISPLHDCPLCLPCPNENSTSANFSDLRLLPKPN